MGEKRNMIYLAALLHDIGKFYQRADKPFDDKFNELSEYSKNIANDICPVNEHGRFGYQHVVWTNEFFEKFNKKLQQIPGIKDNRYENSDTDNIVTFACNHHKPQTLLQSFVTIGDWWSAGIDRIEAPFDKQKSIEWGKGRYKTIPLSSVFNTINKANYNSAFKLKPLSIDKEDIFTSKIEHVSDGVSEQDYKNLWKKFVEEFEKLPTDTVDGFAESLLHLLKKYTWCIPSNTMDMANVSLYEHLKTTAAFADSIYSYYIDGNEDEFTFDKQYNRLQPKGNVHPVVLVGGDISGIQKFIYNIASQKAAVSLKGRSFYLQLLIDSIIQKIITHQDIQATIGHVIYSSGGKFYMILPNTDKVKTALNKIKEKIEKELWEEHKGKLSVNLAFIDFSVVKPTNKKSGNKISIEGIEKNTDLGTLWRTLAEKLNAQKNQKFKSLLNKGFFEQNIVNEDIKMCAVTGEELSKNNRVILKGTNEFVSKAVNRQTELGVALKDAYYLITYRNPTDESKYLSSKSQAHIKVVGVDNYMFKKNELTKDNAVFRKITSADVSRIILFNNTKLFDTKLKGNAVSYGFQFYGGNKQAEYLGKNKTFEELTRTTEDNKDSETYLGVLRMDVDGLGNIFIKGLDEKDKSFAAYATMSFQLDLFFTGYLNTIREKYKDYVNILYSGGDDVFAVGRWDKLIEFAESIRFEFAEFIGRNDISISGGMVIVRNKYPIAKAAELAGDFEDKAKEFKRENSEDKEKNAICFLGETVSWKDEYKSVKELKNEFKRLIDDGMPKGILHKLMEFATIKKANDKHKENDEADKIELSYKWNTAYYLKRFSERFKKNEEIKFFINKLQTDLFETNRSYDIVALAARWAELELREIDD